MMAIGTANLYLFTHFFAPTFMLFASNRKYVKLFIFSILSFK